MQRICTIAERLAQMAGARSVTDWHVIQSLLRVKCSGQLLFEYAYPDSAATKATAAVGSPTDDLHVAKSEWSASALALLSSAEEHAGELGYPEVDSASLALAVLLHPCDELMSLLKDHELTPLHAREALTHLLVGDTMLPPAPDSPVARRLTVYDVPEPYRSDEDVRDCIDLDTLWPEEMYQDTEIVRAARRLRPKSTEDLADCMARWYVLYVQLKRMGGKRERK